MNAEVRGALRRPFREQVAFFRGKLGNLVPTATWRDVWQAQHDRAFMVAGAARADLLTDLAAAVDAAISQGESLDQFRRRFGDIVRQRGWQGWTGSGSEAGFNWRTRTIYRTNMSTSYAAGRLAQLQDSPLWMYKHGGSEDPRPEHLAWDGLVLPADHPFWATHSPPNGWGCSCRIVGVPSASVARRLGGDPDKRLPSNWDTIDRRTGAPVGIDAGWAYQPGASRRDEMAAFAGKSVQWDYELAKAFMASVPVAMQDALAQAIRSAPETGAVIRRYAERALGERNGAPIDERVDVTPYQTMGLLTRAERNRIAELTDQAGVATNLYDWAIDAAGVRHAIAQHGGAGEAARGQAPLEPGDFAVLPALLRVGTIEAAGTGRTGQPIVRVTGTVRGWQYTAAFELRTGRRMLVLQSLWKRAAPPR